MMTIIIHFVNAFDYDRHQCILQLTYHPSKGARMKVTKAQAQENRARIIETASKLFRERGYDGVGVADLMKAAGFTHGGFYKHFESKADLMAQSSAWGLAHTSGLAAGMDAAQFAKQYVSREHRDALSDGCPLVALGGDAARQSAAVKAEFEAGIEALLATLNIECAASEETERSEIRSTLLDMLAHAVGALVLSRACPDDSPLADEILDNCRDRILRSIAQPE